jgi:hypothetical protein
MSTALTRTARLMAAAAVPFVFVAAKPVPFADGMSYEFVMKATSKATGNKEQVTMRGRGTYAGDDAKLEILETSANAGGKDVYGAKGSYFIVKDGGQVMYLVDPNQKQYMKWDMASMLAGMSKVVNAVGGLVKMQMSDIKIDAQDLGAGETVQGYPTRHIRMIQNYTMSASVFGKKSVSRSEATTDYYFAPSLKIANPFVGNSQQMAMMSQFDMFNNPDYKSQMAAAQAKLPKNGVPLKMVTTTTTTDEKGKAETSTAVMEMVNFKAANIPASAFEIPSGYTEIQMPSLNAAMSANGGANGANGATAQNQPGYNADSVAKAAKSGAKEAVDATVKDETKKAVTKKLKGIFKH